MRNNLFNHCFPKRLFFSVLYIPQKCRQSWQNIFNGPNVLHIHQGHHAFPGQLVYSLSSLNKHTVGSLSIFDQYANILSIPGHHHLISDCFCLYFFCFQISFYSLKVTSILKGTVHVTPDIWFAFSEKTKRKSSIHHKFIERKIQKYIEFVLRSGSFQKVLKKCLQDILSCVRLSSMGRNT